MNSRLMLHPFPHALPILNLPKLVLKVVSDLQIQWPLLGLLWTSSLHITSLTNTCSFSFHKSFPWIPTPLTNTLVPFVWIFFHRCCFYFPPTVAQRLGFCSAFSSKIFCQELIHSHGFTYFHKKAPIWKLNCGLTTGLQTLGPTDDRPPLLGYSNMSSCSVSKITLSSPVKDLFPSSWILYILSTGTLSFLIRQLRKLASSLILSSPSILPVQMTRSQKIFLCNKASPCSIFPLAAHSSMTFIPYLNLLQYYFCHITLLFKTTSDFHIHGVGRSWRRAFKALQKLVLSISFPTGNSPLFADSLTQPNSFPHPCVYVGGSR